MPKKDVNDAILGMLSTAGSTTRPAPSATRPARSAGVDQPAADAAPDLSTPAPSPASGPELAAADRPQQREVAPAELPAAGPAAPRTLRLRPTTAQDLRDAWLEAKRDDVLLTSQDFASDLIEEMLKVRRRRTRAAS